MTKLVLLRHGESEWNRMNLFTGWTDVPLSEKGRAEAAEAGKLLTGAKLDFDICYTSYLKRSIHTLHLALEQMDREWLPVIKSWRLNERHYGALQGLNKAETAEKYGEEQVLVWRRSFDITPPPLEADDMRSPYTEPMYRGIPKEELPLTESLKTTIDRVIPYYHAQIEPDIRAGKRVLIAAHGNSLRALVMHLEQLSSDEIMQINIPTGVPLVYELDASLSVAKKYYLGDQESLQKKLEQVANQGKATTV